MYPWIQEIWLIQTATPTPRIRTVTNIPHPLVEGRWTGAGAGTKILRESKIYTETL